MSVVELIVLGPGEGETVSVPSRARCDGEILGTAPAQRPEVSIDVARVGIAGAGCS
jgi:hypothetical protein